jgi:hypothetical protein
MSVTFGTADEAVYYTLLLMPPNGNISEAFAYTTAEIFAFWEANHETSPDLAAHTHVILTQALVDAAISRGSARALYRIVFADETNSRYMINHLLKQLPVESLRFLRLIGVFDQQIAAAQATCNSISVPVIVPAPAIPSSVQPPKQPMNFTLDVQLAPVTVAVAGGCVPTGVETTANSLAALGLSSALTSTCDVVEFP